MTTKVRIEIEAAHLPVVIERSDGLYPKTIKNKGEAIFEYVHGTQTLTIREVSMDQAHKADVDQKVGELEQLQGRNDLSDTAKQALQAGIAALKGDKK